MFSGFLQCWFSTINIIEALLQSPVGVVARTIKVGVVICCCHLGVCCEGHVLLQPQNGCVAKGIREAFIDYNKVSTHMIKAAAGQVSANHIHTTIIVAMVTQRSIITQTIIVMLPS